MHTLHDVRKRTTQFIEKRPHVVISSVFSFHSFFSVLCAFVFLSADFFFCSKSLRLVHFIFLSFFSLHFVHCSFSLVVFCSLVLLLPFTFDNILYLELRAQSKEEQKSYSIRASSLFSLHFCYTGFYIAVALFFRSFFCSYLFCFE